MGDFYERFYEYVVPYKTKIVSAAFHDDRYR